MSKITDEYILELEALLKNANFARDTSQARIRELEAALREAIQWMRDSAEGEEGAGFHKSAVKELEVAGRWESVLGSTSETDGPCQACGGKGCKHCSAQETEAKS